MLTVDDFATEPCSENVLLEGEPLRFKSQQKLRDAAMFSLIDLTGAKTALDCERMITAYFIRRLCNAQQLRESERRPPKRAKADTPKGYRTVNISLLESPVSPLEDSI